jgi:hypothetical protein
MHRLFLLCLSGLAGSGCANAPTPSAAPSFAGAYDTAVSVTENSCGAITVLPAVTTVAHQPGSAHLTLTHAGISYPGTVTRDSSFTTDTVTLEAHGDRYRIHIVGRFTAGGFDALTTVDQITTQTGAACRYVVHWIGSRHVAR